MLYTFFSNLLLRVYCLDLPAVCVLLLAAALLFCLLHRRWGGRFWWRAGMLAGLVLWAGAVLYVTVLGREAGRAGGGFGTLLHSYRTVLAGGNPELLRSNFMNVVLFFPGGLFLGALLPRRWPRCARALVVLVCLGGLSFGIEYFQYLHDLGNAEADDILHNALGAMAAGLCIPPEHHT